jgi:hypothetical protein
MLQIPSFVQEIRNEYGSETMEIVVSRNRAPVFAAPFSGIALEYALASRTTTPATVTNHLVRCSRSVIISPYVVPRASLLGRRTYLDARYSTILPQQQRIKLHLHCTTMDRYTILKDRDFQTLMLHARQYYKDGNFDNYTVTFKEMLEHIKGITDNANSKCKPGNLLSYLLLGRIQPQHNLQYLSRLVAVQLRCWLDP